MTTFTFIKQQVKQWHISQRFDMRDERDNRATLVREKTR